MNTFKGIVQEGSKRARALGYPTANIKQDDRSISGVYAAIVRIDKAMYHAVAFADPARQLLEAHIFGVNESMYGRNMSIELMQKIRETVRFEDDEALRLAIEEDIAKVREYFNT